MMNEENNIIINEVKEKKGKKHLLTFTIIMLAVWNLFLTYSLFNQPKVDGNGNVTENTGKVVQNQTFATTDLTKTAEKGSERTVGISTGSGSGSGAIYKSERSNDKSLVTIITNYHVVTTQKTVDVVFANEQTVTGNVIGGDIYTDLAVVQVETDFAVEAFNIGDSSTLKRGEWVLAIGSPLGLQFNGTVTEGIISGKDRIIGVDLNQDGQDDWDMSVLQTTAAINPGNSGGPLINLNGDLIGINSMKISSDKVEGMGFAIPINEAVPIVEQLIEKGVVTRPLIGVSGRNLSDYTTSHRSYLGLPLDVENGVVITDVITGGAGEKSGLLAGDIITKINDVDVENFKNFRMELYKHKSGEEITLEVYSKNESKTVSVILEW